MNPETEVTCPDCGCEFTPAETTMWNVCLTCGQIWEPGVDWNPHHRDDSVDCDGVHSVRTYTEEAARERQQRVRGD